MNILTSYMANQKRNKPKLEYLKLAFELAKINIGSTKSNPSVGCVVERNGSVISTGFTSVSGRPHAEYNALNKNIDFKNSNIYVTLEPCSHFGKTPPCTNLISKKGVQNVFYSLDDFDKRSKNKSKKKLSKKNIKVVKNLLKKEGTHFYKSYNKLKSLSIPLIDAKIAFSKDYFTKNLKQKWITSNKSRKLVHLLRSQYDAIISTSKSINEDNSLLDCRIECLKNKSPDLIIIDRNLKIKKNLKIFKYKNHRKIYLFSTLNNYKKISWLKKKNVKVILLKKMNQKKDFHDLFKNLIKRKYSRIFVESGLTFTNFLIKNKMIDNLYLFKSNLNLNKNGINYGSNRLIKKIKLTNKLQTNLDNDRGYIERIK